MATTRVANIIDGLVTVGDTDEEIEKRFASMRERAARITHTKSAEVIRFLYR